VRLEIPLFVFLALSSAFAAPATSDKRMAMARGHMSDCNLNGLLDSLDIAEGFDDDDNHNGVIDLCDSDPAAASRARTDDTWRRFVDSSDSCYFQVRKRMIANNHGILIRYTIPHAEQVVTLSVRRIDDQDADTVLVDGQRQAGAIELGWNRMIRGRQVHSGHYEFTLRVGTRVYTRRLAWIT
jgi:hypothetical protein